VNLRRRPIPRPLHTRHYLPLHDGPPLEKLDEIASTRAKHTEDLELIGKKSCLCVDLSANEEKTEIVLERVWKAKFRVTKQFNVLATVQCEGPNHVADLCWKTQEW
jgi:hypothetical protein